MASKRRLQRPRTADQRRLWWRSASELAYAAVSGRRARGQGETTDERPLEGHFCRGVEDGGGGQFRLGPSRPSGDDWPNYQNRRKGAVSIRPDSFGRSLVGRCRAGPPRRPVVESVRGTRHERPRRSARGSWSGAHPGPRGVRSGHRPSPADGRRIGQRERRLSHTGHMDPHQGGGNATFVRVYSSSRLNCTKTTCLLWWNMCDADHAGEGADKGLRAALVAGGSAPSAVGDTPFRRHFDGGRGLKLAPTRAAVGRHLFRAIAHWTHWDRNETVTCLLDARWFSPHRHHGSLAGSVTADRAFRGRVGVTRAGSSRRAVVSPPGARVRSPSGGAPCSRHADHHGRPR